MIPFKLLIKSSVHLLLFIAYPTIDYDQLSKKEITSVVLLSPIKRLLSPTQLHAKIDPSQLSTQPTSYTTRLPIISSPANEQFKFYLPVHIPLPFINLPIFQSASVQIYKRLTSIGSIIGQRFPNGNSPNTLPQQTAIHFQVEN